MQPKTEHTSLKHLDLNYTDPLNHYEENILKAKYHYGLYNQYLELAEATHSKDWLILADEEKEKADKLNPFKDETHKDLFIQQHFLT